MTNANDIIISIVCTTFNHEKYIAQALDGFIMQQTSFPFEIIIHDDASTDNTAQIIREYESKYPDLFVSIYQTENQYSKKDVNIWADITLPKARGKYIAICEGDDYWTDPYKLQKQVDFLEKNLEFSFCCHRYRIFSTFYDRYNDSIFPLDFYPLISTYNGIVVTKKEYHHNWMTQLLTATIRKKDFLNVMKLSTQFKYFRDTHLFYYLLDHGNGICLDFIGGVYRQNEGGIYSGIPFHKRQIVDFQIFEELYIITKDIKFLNHYSSLAFHLIIKGLYLPIVLKSLFFTLSSMDKLNILRSRFQK